jgi:GNAT superfamily N-acetyltransferase
MLLAHSARSLAPGERRTLVQNAEIVVRKPTVAEYCRLRRSCGWPVPEAAACESALGNSVLGVVALLNGDTVGMGRVVGDGALWNYIQDVVVLPEHQRKGLGRMLMDAIMRELAKTAAVGSDVALISAPGKVPFYERYGFAVCTPDRPAMRRKL